MASSFGVARVAIKNEQMRFGLPAYKVLGGSWALHETIRRLVGVDAGKIMSLAALRDALAHRARITFCTATDGNHGRGIAHMAELLGCDCVIFVPEDMVAERADAIRAHHATVRVADGGYDIAVNAASAFVAGQPERWLCADTVTPTDGDAGRRFACDVQNGYVTLFSELVEQFGSAPDVCFVQSGVGALAASAVHSMASLAPHCRIITVEPADSACVLASIEADRPHSVRDSFTIMAGLRAQSISELAWPTLRRGVFAATSIADQETVDAMRALAAVGVESGESGAAGLAGLHRVFADHELRASLGFGHSTSVALINTEGATDRARYTRLVIEGRSECLCARSSVGRCAPM